MTHTLLKSNLFIQWYLTAYRCWEHRLPRTYHETLTDDHIFIPRHEGAGVWDCLYSGTRISPLARDGSGNCQLMACNRDKCPISSQNRPHSGVEHGV